MRRILHVFYIVLIISTELNAQNWIRIFEGFSDVNARNVFEHYDRGFLISGRRWEGNNKFGWMMKTDVNGYQRWSKYYGITGRTLIFNRSSLTKDGGIICIGGSNGLNQNSYDPLVVKFNPCGEKEWCKLYNAPYENSSGVDIVPIEGGNGYIALIHNWLSGPEVWLFRIDSIGEIIWTQEFVTNQNIFWSPQGEAIIETTDSCFLVTGEAYTPDSLTPGYSLLKMFLIKVTLNGLVEFELPWGMNNGSVSEGHQTVEDKHHNFYSAGRRVGTSPPTVDMPSLFVSSPTGLPILFSDFRSPGLATTINWLQDSTLVIGADFQDASGGDTVVVAKSDTNGNILKTQTLISNENISFTGADVTDDNKIILVGNTFLTWQYCYLFKLNSELEYDSLYSNLLVYDSLCPHLILSDTTELNDCDEVIVNIDEVYSCPETSKLHIYPNPACSSVTIELPKYLVKNVKNNGVKVNTIYYQWKEARLEIYNQLGRLKFNEGIKQKNERIIIEISDWRKGLYIARVIFMNEVVCDAKFLIE